MPMKSALEKLMIVLRDGRTLIGYLRTVDQFGLYKLTECSDGPYCLSVRSERFLCHTANLVLHRTVERIHVGKQYGDIPRGIFVIRGENVILLGEVVRSCESSIILSYIVFCLKLNHGCNYARMKRSLEAQVLWKLP